MSFWPPDPKQTVLQTLGNAGDVRLQQRPSEMSKDGRGGWFAARRNGWTSCVDHAHRSPEGASACFRRTTNQEATRA